MRQVGRAGAARIAGIVLLSVGSVACSDTGPTGTEPSPTATIVTDASAEWGYVRLGLPASGVSVADAGTSSDWDIAFHATSVMLNGGTNGPGGVVGYCICQNAGATDEQVLAMTPESELGAFEAVDAGDVPAASHPGWSADVFEPEMARWYRYNLTGTHQITPTHQVYLLRRGSTVYKVQLIGYYGPAGETRRITMRYSRVAE